MKTLFTSLFIAALFLTSCKKDSSNNGGSNAGKTYLVSKITFTIMPGGFTTTEQYSYDSQNRVISFDSYRYTYDNNNNLLTVTDYDAGNLTSTDNYTYSGDTVTVKTIYADGAPDESCTFILNSKQQAVSLSSGNQQYTYDSNGNVASYSACCSPGQYDSFTYDSQKNPLSMIGAKNLHLEYLAQGAPVTTVNNVTKDNAAGNSFTYTYNSAGFPVTATVTNGNGVVTNLTNEYIVK